MYTGTFDAAWFEQPHDGVLGGGGIKGLSHLGFAQALIDHNISIAEWHCTSIGALVGAFIANQYPPKELEDIFISELKHFGKDAFITALKQPKRIRRLQQGGLVDLEPIIGSMVDRYNLRPQPNLKIVAAYRQGARMRPYLFEGLHYDLRTALHAACAAPFFMQARWIEVDGKRIRLVDGGLFHTEPYHFVKRPAIISRLGMARDLPKHKLTASDWLIHAGEMVGYQVKRLLLKKPGTEHLVITTGDPRVATFTFNIDDEVCRQMIQHGYQQTDLVLRTLKESLKK